MSGPDKVSRGFGDKDIGHKQVVAFATGEATLASLTLTSLTGFIIVANFIFLYSSAELLSRNGDCFRERR